MMAFSGVRSSWLMLARKALLVRLACSAASLATVSSASRSWICTSISLKPSMRTPSSSSVSFTARRREVFLPRDAHLHLGEVADGARDELLELGGEEQGGEQRGQHDDGHDPGVVPQPRGQLLHVGLDEDRAQDLAFAGHELVDAELAVLEVGAFLARERGHRRAGEVRPR